jgi:D-3-phosphoglycerate dehydrogenase
MQSLVKLNTVQAEYMGKKIVITPSSFGKVTSNAMDLLKQNFSELKINNTGKKIPDSEVVNFYQDADYAIAGLELLNSNILKCLPQLKVISRVGIGLDNIDLEYANNNNIKVLNTPDPPTDAVSEITITAALSITRNLFNYNKDFHASQWNKSVSSSLKNKNILILGSI